MNVVDLRDLVLGPHLERIEKLDETIRDLRERLDSGKRDLEICHQQIKDLEAAAERGKSCDFFCERWQEQFIAALQVAEKLGMPSHPTKSADPIGWLREYAETAGDVAQMLGGNDTPATERTRRLKKLLDALGDYANHNNWAALCKANGTLPDAVFVAAGWPGISGPEGWRTAEEALRPLSECSSVADYPTTIVVTTACDRL